jgi:hypothetical protein
LLSQERPANMVKTSGAALVERAGVSLKF